MRSRRTRIAAVWLVSAQLTTGCAALADQPDSEAVRIAADLELSGEFSHIGSVYRNALELRVEQVNEQGLLGENRTIELIVRDNRSDPAVSTSNIRDFASDPSVAAIVSGACWQCLEAALDTINAEAIPTISLAAPDAVVEPLQERRYIYKLGLNPSQAAAALFAELPEDADTLALVATDDLYGTDGVKAIEDLVKGVDLEIVIKEVLTPDGGGISAAAQRIADYNPSGVPSNIQNGSTALGPDAVIAWGYAPFGADVAAALRGSGYHGPLLLDPAAADDLFISGTSAAALDGAVLIFPETLVIDEVVATSPAKAARQNWFSDYTARHGTYDAFSSFAADAIEILVFSINRVGSADRELLRDALESVQMDGLTGAIRMSPQHHSGLMASALTPLLARDERWRLAG